MQKLGSVAMLLIAESLLRGVLIPRALCPAIVRELGKVLSLPATQPGG